jgi:hypothetical protein
MAGHPADGGHPGGRRTGGRADTPAGRGRGGALYYGWAYMLTLWGKGGYGGSPNVEAGKMYQHTRSCPYRSEETGGGRCGCQAT